MKRFTAWEWLLIDAATQYGLDKQVFETRLQWSIDHIHELEDMASHEWKEKPLYLKAVMAIRKVQKGESTGHMIGIDSSASGMQLMSAITNCISGATATGLIDPDKRADVYTEATALINKELVASNLSISVPRADMKQAIMTLKDGVTA
jgi:DNA-directed RNA polymerase